MTEKGVKPLSEPTPNGSEESGSESDERDSAWVSIGTNRKREHDRIRTG